MGVALTGLVMVLAITDALRQLELAIVEYIAWFNNDRLHESLGDLTWPRAG